jgi:fatty acid desaturase
MAWTAIMYATCLIYCLSPALWRVWHNRVHHGHTNVPGEDPDCFGTIDQFQNRWLSRSLWKFLPGSGHLHSILFFFIFFTVQSQGVLARYGFTRCFRGLNRLRAGLDTALMISFWALAGYFSGIRDALFVIVLPMLLVNFIHLSYIVTNHMLSPLASGVNTLDTTMSVRSSWIADFFFFYYSHHLEHHLFPSMSSRYYPLVRSSLCRHVGDRYVAPPHWKAFLLVVLTPRLYADASTLIDPVTRRRVALTEVRAALAESLPPPAPTSPASTDTTPKGAGK